MQVVMVVDAKAIEKAIEKARVKASLVIGNVVYISEISGRKGKRQVLPHFFWFFVNLGASYSSSLL